MPISSNQRDKGSEPKKKQSAAGSTAGKGLSKPVEPSGPLAAIVGPTPVPRTEITKKVWEYIKRHNLQDPQNKRMIKADPKLAELFGGKKEVSMFELTKLVNQHLK